MTHQEDRYDIVIFGATGFTGQFVVDEVARTAGNKRWAIAGRTEAKLDAVLQTGTQNTGLDLHAIPKIIADVSNVPSLEAMAQKARVIIDTVGPYRFYGEPVVKACVQYGSSYVDISGEPDYMETMYIRYHEQAKQNGVYIVSACGYDSVPCDIGFVFIKQQFKGDLHSVDTFLEHKVGPQGTKLHAATFRSMIHSIKHRHEEEAIHAQCMPKTLPQPHPPARVRKGLYREPRLNNGWVLPFPGSDKGVATRTQYYDYFEKVPNKRPVQIETYWKLRSLPEALGVIVWGGMVFLLAQFACSRRLMENHPGFFSFGYFSHDGPTRQQLEGTKFSYWLFGKGWKNRLANPDEQHTDQPDATITCRVDGPDPGYTATSAIMVACAMTILDDRDKLPSKGGVYSPGAAFEDTRLIERLNSRGVTFQVIDG